MLGMQGLSALLICSEQEIQISVKLKKGSAKNSRKANCVK